MNKLTSDMHINEEVKAALKRAYRKFLINDLYLFDSKLHEQSLTHKYAEYVQLEFPSWHVDCEYSKIKNSYEQDELKRIYIDDINSSVRPDIIVHQRGTGNNFIAIESKKSGQSTHRDKNKLKAYKEQLSYRYAFLVEFTNNPSKSLISI